ncbi:MAG: GldL-related protein [Flammeovirgaceae bacterium]
MNTLKVISITACTMVIVGVTLKILHWQGGAIVLGAGFGLFFVFLGLRSFYEKQHTKQ